MQIGCTKKLLDTLDVTVCNQIEENDLFCWSANLLTIKRRKAVVVINDSNRFGFVPLWSESQRFQAIECTDRRGDPEMFTE